MPILIHGPPADHPEATPDRYACLHPEAPYSLSFQDGKAYWSSAALYCLAQRLAAPEDREKVRAALELPRAKALAASLPERSDADAHLEEHLRHAMQRGLESNLRARAVLLGTGEEPIEAHLGDDARLGVGRDGRGENLLGMVLMEVRAQLRPRAEDPDAVQCIHADSSVIRVVCEHFLSASPATYRRHFTGKGTEYELLCDDCCAALPAPPPRRRLCGACEHHLRMGARGSDLGTPAFLERASTVRFTHRQIAGPEHVIALAPISRVPNSWLLLDRDGRFHRLDVERGTHEAGGRVDPTSVDLSKPLVLVVAPGGELAAVGEAYAQRAVVLEPASGKVSQTLERGDYHVENCTFPLAFFELEGRLLLVHGTDWNRLDVSDPRTGALLSPREEVELDYFHSELCVAPDGARLLDYGWMWHPCGMVRTFDLRRWVKENPREPEDGPSLKSFSDTAYFWDGPVAWLDPTTVAVWGGADGDPETIRAARIFDVESGEALRTFYGVEAGLASVPPYLVAFEPERGTSVWDWHTGERLAVDGSFCPVAVHPCKHELLSRVDGGGFRVSRLLE